MNKHFKNWPIFQPKFFCDVLLRVHESTVLSSEDEILTFCQNNNIATNGLHLFGIIIKAYLFLAEKLGSKKDEAHQNEGIEIIESSEEHFTPSLIPQIPRQSAYVPEDILKKGYPKGLIIPFPEDQFSSNNSRKRHFDVMQEEEENNESKVQIVSTDNFEAPFEHELCTVGKFFTRRKYGLSEFHKLYFINFLIKNLNSKYLTTFLPFELFTSVKSETHEDHEIIEFDEEDTELIDTGEAGTSMSFIHNSSIEEKTKPSTKATSFTGNPSKFYQLWESKLNSNVLINLIFNSFLFAVIAL